MNGDKDSVENLESRDYLCTTLVEEGVDVLELESPSSEGSVKQENHT
jgi:hypothetical protein